MNKSRFTIDHVRFESGKSFEEVAKAFERQLGKFDPDVRKAATEGGDTEAARLVAWGPGPRAAQALMLASRARALIDGRFSPSLDDVAALAEPILKHRMALTYAARAEGETVSGFVKRLASKILDGARAGA